MKFRAAVSASKALWHRSVHYDRKNSKGGHPAVKHKDSDGAATATTAKSSSCGTAEPEVKEGSSAAALSSPSSSSSLIKLAKAVSMTAKRVTHTEGGRRGGEVRSVSSSSMSTGCRTGPLQPGDPLRRQITGPFLLEDTDRSYIDDDEKYNDDDGEAGLRRIRGHPFEMTEEDKRVILSCLAHQQHRGNADDSLRRTLSAGSFATPTYRVEICAKGLEDDDTLDGIMTEKLRAEADAENAKAARNPVVGLFRARSGGSKGSAGGILASLRRSSGSVVSSLSGHVGRASARGHGGGGGGGQGGGQGGDDTDTLDEFMAREEFKEEDRGRRLRRVGSGILESLDRLRRSHSFLLDRNELWLKRALEAIEDAKPTYMAPRGGDGVGRYRQPPTHPRDIVVKRPASPVPKRPASPVLKRPASPVLKRPASPVLKRPASPTIQPVSASPTLWETIGGGQQEEPSTPPLIEQIQDKVEAMFPRCTVAGERLPVVMTPTFLSASTIEEDDDPTSLSPVPTEEDANVALIEVVVHYLTCGHVLREQELKHSPRIICPAVVTAFGSRSPILMPYLEEPEGRQETLPLQRRGELQHPRRRWLCASVDCYGDDDDDDADEDDEEFDDDEDRSYQSDYDDGTLEGSLRRRTSKKLWTTINSAFARSSTETTCEEKKASD